MRAFVLKKTDAVYVAYNEFKSILAPKLTITKLLPVEPSAVIEEKESLEQGSGLTAAPPDWEPGTVSFLATLLPHYVEDQIRHFFLESLAAEHAARMMAMDNATKNAEELIDDLTLVLNKIRQASITKELLEIISAVEALGIK
jgi:F-type H+-transporting ATPase subunit gamma